MDETLSWFGRLKEQLAFPLLSIGGTEITLWNVLTLVVLLVLIGWGSGKLRRWTAHLLRHRGGFEVGTAEAVGSIVRYSVVFLGLLIAVQTAGLDLTTLNVLAGAVGLGVGFGLQGIANNFISGLIILFGRPIKIGDRIEVAGVEGDVVDIRARATTVVTNDNISIIVPNSKLVSETVINWSHNDRKVRFRIPVQVAYGSDVRKVERLLLDVAAANADVLDNPAPVVRFVEFGESGLQMELRAWSTTLIHRKGLLISNLNFGIYERFAAEGVEIPFPQRVVHFRPRSEVDPS